MIDWKPIDDDARDGREVLLRRGSTVYAGYYGLARKAFGAGACTRFPWTILDNTNGVNNIRDGGTDGVTHYADIAALVAQSPADRKTEA